MVARKLDTNDKALCRLMMMRTSANLKHWVKKRGLVRSMLGPGRQLFVGSGALVILNLSKGLLEIVDGLESYARSRKLQLTMSERAKLPPRVTRAIIQLIR
jgi:hypothetical protein